MDAFFAGHGYLVVNFPKRPAIGVEYHTVVENNSLCVSPIKEKPQEQYNFSGKRKLDLD